MKRKGMGFEVRGKKVYLLGGGGWCESATDEVYSYDASLNAWGEASPLSTARCYFSCEIFDDNVVVDGKVYARCGTCAVTAHVHAVVYEPSMGEGAWLTRPPCQLVAIGKKCYVGVKGLGTVMFDARKGLVNSVPELSSDDHVIGCKCISI